MQYCTIVDEVTDALVAQEIASLKGMRATAVAGAYGRYMTICDYGCKLQFNSQFWSVYRPTPLWFGIQEIAEKRWVFSMKAREKLVKLEMEEPSHLIQVGEELLVPLYIPTGVEKSDVVDSLLAQLRVVLGYLGVI